MLGFITGREQQDLIFDAGSGTLECDEHTIWLVAGDEERHESTTIASAIDIWLRQGLIEELHG
jgi:hypothetical protein